MEDVSEASWRSKKAEEIVAGAFELFVEAAEVLMLAEKEGFEYLREIFCYSEKVQSGEAFGHSLEDFGHWEEVFWPSVEDFGYWGEVFGPSDSGQAFWHSVDAFGHFGEAFGIAFGHFVDVFENPATAPGHFG